MDIQCCQVVTESMVFVFATSTFVSSCGSSLPRCLWFLAKKLFVAAELGYPCGIFDLGNKYRMRKDSIENIQIHLVLGSFCSREIRVGDIVIEI